MVTRRSKTKEIFAEFLEDNVGRKWKELRNHRLKLEARLEQSHEVRKDNCCLVKQTKDG